MRSEELVIELLFLSVLFCYFVMMLFLDDVKQVGSLDDDVAEVGLAKEVALRTPVDVAETVVVARLQLEVAQAWMAPFRTQSGSDAVVELRLYGHVLLLHDGVGASCAVGGEVGRRIVALGRFAQVESDLRTRLEEEAPALGLLSPCQVGEDRDLHVVDRALVSLCVAIGVDDGLVGGGEDVLLPSERGIVDLRGNGADRGKIFLAGIAD